MRTQRRTRGGAVRCAPAPALLLALGLAACDLDTLLEVPDPEVATPQSLQGRAALAVVLAGAKADFQFAFSGGSVSAGGEGQVNITGLFTDELHYGSTFPTRIQVDMREILNTNTTLEPIHRFMHRARALARSSVELHEEFSPNSAGHAESSSLYGYTLVLFAENYCSGVPLSRLSASGAAEFGAPQTTQALLEGAVAAFDAAIAAAGTAGSQEQLNLARVGKARALLDLDRATEAAAAAAAVPTSFVYHVHHSENSARQENGSYNFQYLGRRWSVADREGGNGLPFRSAMDPRVPWERGTGGQSVAFDDSPLYLTNKYPSRTAPTVLASGVEARLIEAEAALRAGDASWLTTLNVLRSAPPAYYPAATYPGIGSLGPLQDPGTAAARVDLMFAERAYWMYLTSHRLGDLRRLVRQYNRPASTVYPVGEWGVWTPSKSGEYGSDLNLPIPFDEHNNPQFSGCLNRDA